MSWRNFLAKIWWIVILEIVLVTGGFYFVMGWGIKASLKEQIFEKQMTIAAASSSNISGFLENIGKTLVVLAQSREIQAGGTGAGGSLDTFFSSWENNGIVAGIILVDDKGNVLEDYNLLDTHDTGLNLSEREYFKWAKDQTKGGNYLVGRPIEGKVGFSKGKMIIPVASPVFVDSKFKGVVVVSVLLKPLTERYLNYMRIDDLGNIYLVDDLGNSLYESSNTILSKGIKNSIENSGAGNFEKDGKLISYNTINLGNQRLLVIVTAPVQQLYTNSIPFRVRQGIILFFIAFVTLLYGRVVYYEVQNKL